MQPDDIPTPPPPPPPNRIECDKGEPMWYVCGALISVFMLGVAAGAGLVRTVAGCG